MACAAVHCRRPCISKNAQQHDCNIYARIGHSAVAGHILIPWTMPVRKKPRKPSQVPMSEDAVLQACQEQCRQWTLLLDPLERLIPFNLETPHVPRIDDGF